MIKLQLCLLGLILTTFSVFSQTKELSYYDIEVGRYYHLRPQTLKGLKWLDINHLIYVKDDSLIKIRITASDESKILLTQEDLNNRLEDIGLDKLKSLPGNIQPVDNENIQFTVHNNVLRYNLNANELTKLFTIPDGAGNLEYTPDKSRIAYTLGQNIFVTDAKTPKLKITFDTLDGIVNGQIPHRNEFGIHNGSFWSPSANKLAWYYKDETMVSQYPIVDISERVATVKNTRYPMAGMTSEQVKIKIYNLATKKTVELATGGDPEQYLTNISWAPDDSEIFVQHLNRAQDHMHLVSYNTETGKVVDTLFDEKHEKYVEPLNPIVFSKINSINFYYQSARDGYNHIYSFDSRAGKLKQLSKGKWEVTEFIGFDANEEFIYFMATKDSPLENNLYKLNLKSTKVERITQEPGTHTINLNSSYTYFIDKFSSTTVPNNISIRSTNGNQQTVLINAPNPLSNYKLGKTEQGTFKAADEKTELYYRLIKPVDFQMGRKYPVVFYVYGGPHAQMIKNSWIGRSELWLQYMASKGFVGVLLDTRGSAARGMKFENVIHRQSGMPQRDDIVKAVEFLSNKNFIDTSRIGIHGWSYGGYMTITMMTHYPDIFKVGVAGGPVTNWKYYEVMYGERYMDTPEENPEGYYLTNLNKRADQLSGKLKIIHGAIDPTVVWQHSLSFMQACVKADKIPDCFIYPMHKHNVRGADRLHLVKVISEYFIANL